MTKILPASEVKARFYRLIEGVAIGDEIIVTKNGRPTVALLSARDLSSLKETLDVLSDKNLMRQIRASEREIKQGKKRYSYEEVVGEPLIPKRKEKRSSVRR